MCVTSFSLSQLVYNGSRIVSTGREESAEFLDQNRTIMNTCTTRRCLKNTLFHKVPLQNNPSCCLKLHTPVEPRPGNRLGPLTHWESCAGSHKDQHHQNYNLPTGDLQPGRQAGESNPTNTIGHISLISDNDVVWFLQLKFSFTDTNETDILGCG